MHKQLYTRGVSLRLSLLGGLFMGLCSAYTHAAVFIEAESYNAMQGIQTETTSDAGGGLNIGWTDAGDWLSYPAVSLPCSGTYTVEYRVASAAQGGKFVLEKAGGGATYDTVTVPNTGGWQTWTSVFRDVTLPAGNLALGIAVPQGGWNLNWIRLTPKCTVATSSSLAKSSVVSTLSSSKAATSSSVASVTSKIQAENYNRFYDLTTGNTGGAYRQDNVDIEATTDTDGGYNVGWVDATEWLEYDAYLPAGTYDVTARVASANGSKLTVTVVNGNALSANVPATGGWQTWQTVTVGTVTISSLSKVVRVDMTGGGFNLNWLEIKPHCVQNCGADDIPAKAAVSAMGKGFNLGNMFDTGGGSFGAAKAKIDAYYARGFRNVRIPITWTENIDGNKLANSDTGVVDLSNPRLTAIKQSVDYALSLPGLYVVINAHHEDGLKLNNKAAVLERLWQDIAGIFKDRSHRLVFEFLNEPHLPDGSAMNPANLRNMTAKAYAKVRAVDPKRVVAIGGNQWFGYNEVPAVWTNLAGVGDGYDNYMMVEFHHYNPWSFCGDNQGDYADNWTDADQSGPMDTMANWANSVGRGMPVYIGEWGVGWGSRYTAMHCNNIRKYYSSFNSKMASPKGQATAVWDDGGWFKIFDGQGFANNLIDCIDGNCTWEGTDRFAGCQ